MSTIEINGETDDGTLEWWLHYADAVEQFDSRAAREQHQQRVRKAIGSHTDRLVYWNCGVCNKLDVSIHMAARP